MVLFGVLSALECTSDILGLQIGISNEYLVPNSASKVDFGVFSPNGKGIVIDVKSHSAFQDCTSTLEQDYNPLTFNNTGESVEKLLGKVKLKTLE